MITSVKLHRYPTAEVLCSQAGQLKGPPHTISAEELQLAPGWITSTNGPRQLAELGQDVEREAG